LRVEFAEFAVDSDGQVRHPSTGASELAWLNAVYTLQR